MSQKALFLDRDGVINEEIGYLHKPSDVRFIDGIFPLCRTAHALGYRLVVVTNQSGIARGLYSEEDFDNLTKWMLRQFHWEGVNLDAVLYCPYHPEHGVGHYKREHEDRKPSPGMLHRAAKTFSLDLSQSILIGDRCSDIAAAHSAALRHAFLLSGTETNPCTHPHTLISRLSEAQSWLQAL